MTHGLYRVVGKREYRGHAPGDEFEAKLDPNAERRAIHRGDIVLLRRVKPSIEPGSYRFPDRWLWPSGESNEAPAGASLVEGGG